MAVQLLDGDVLLDGGDVAISDDCCCIEYVEGNCCGDDCDQVPKYLQVRFPGVAACGDCGSDCGCWDDCDCDYFSDATFICESSGTCNWAFKGPSCYTARFYRVQVRLSTVMGYVAVFIKAGFNPTNDDCYFHSALYSLSTGDCDICDYYNTERCYNNTRTDCSTYCSDDGCPRCLGDGGQACVIKT